MSGLELPFCSIAAIAIPIDNISFITPHGPLGLAQVTASPTIGAAATIVFHSSGVKSALLAIEIASRFWRSIQSAFSADPIQSPLVRLRGGTSGVQVVNTPRI